MAHFKNQVLKGNDNWHSRQKDFREKEKPSESHILQVKNGDIFETPLQIYALVGKQVFL